MRIRIHPAFALYLLSMAVFSSWQMTLCAMGALLVHEAGHYAAARLLGEVCRAVLIAQRVSHDARTAIVPGENVDIGALNGYIAAPDNR